MYLAKSKQEILSVALSKLAKKTDIKATSPGSVARSIAELVSDDLGDFFATLDFNMKQSSISTATGRSLDLLGSLYNLPRKTLSSLSAESQITGSFYFYSETPVPFDVTIPTNTIVSTNDASIVGQQFSYATSGSVTIQAGRTRAYVGLVNMFSDTVYTAAPDSLVRHNFSPPIGITIYCTNPKEIASKRGFEPDGEYRSRLIQEIRRASGGTSLAMRLAGLSINGVRDIVMRESVAGLGSVELIVNAEDYSNIDTITNLVTSAVALVRPPGIRVFIRQPTMMLVGMRPTLTIKRTNKTSEDQVKFRAKNAIIRYINTLKVGEPLIYNRLVSAILESSDEVIDVSFVRLDVNGTEILRKNYSPKDDEHIIPGDINVQIG